MAVSKTRKWKSSAVISAQHRPGHASDHGSGEVATAIGELPLVALAR